MPALGPNETSDCTNPVLDLFTQIGQSLTDMSVVEFQIFEKVTNPAAPIQVFPGAGRQALNVVDLCPTGDKFSTGRYVAEYTVPPASLIGTHEIRWFFKHQTTSVEQLFIEEFEVLAVALPAGASYCTVQDLRDEGVPDTGPSAVTDDRLTKLILQASRQVDKFTNRFFNPRTLSFTLDGRGKPSIHLDQPIISVTRVEIEDSGIDLGSIVTYNRHITQSLLEPDDRENPRIEIVQPLSDELLFKIGLKVFPRGQLNVRIEGIFGYTDPDGSAVGATPFDICEAVKLIVIRNLPLKFGGDAQEAANEFRITELRTRDQSIKYANPFSTGAGYQGPGPFFGDMAIDRLLLAYKAPPRMRSV